MVPIRLAAFAVYRFFMIILGFALILTPCGFLAEDPLVDNDRSVFNTVSLVVLGFAIIVPYRVISNRTIYLALFVILVLTSATVWVSATVFHLIINQFEPRSVFGAILMGAILATNSFIVWHNGRARMRKNGTDQDSECYSGIIRNATPKIAPSGSINHAKQCD